MQDDFRPAMVFDDISGLNLKKIDIPLSAALPVIIYKRVTRLAIADIAITEGDIETKN